MGGRFGYSIVEVSQLSSTRIDIFCFRSCLFLLRTAQSEDHEKESYVKKIYVGNFSFQMTEPELRALFEPFGAVESASLATDRDTGRSRGFGFVSMTNDDEAEKAMAALNGKDSGGRALTVNEARPQTQRGGFREGGRGDRGPRQRREPRW
jgi:cold-inducible RNA-binding protein